MHWSWLERYGDKPREASASLTRRVSYSQQTNGCGVDGNRQSRQQRIVDTLEPTSFMGAAAFLLRYDGGAHGRSPVFLPPRH